MLNYHRMAALQERPETSPRRLNQVSVWRDTIEPIPQNDIQPPYPQPENLLSLIGMVTDLKTNGVDIKSLAGGLPPTKPLENLWQKYLPKIASKLATLDLAFQGLQYGSAQGNLEFRKWAANEISQESKVNISPNQILTLPGSQFGISTALLSFCANEGKIALTSTPTYSAFLEAAENPVNIPVIAVESDNQGMIPEKFENIIKLLREKGIETGLAYSMVYGNPSGEVMTDERAQQLNEICKKYNIPFIVDHAYHRLTSETENIPTIQYLDDNVILLFTASKLYSPGERVAWAVIPEKNKLKKMKESKQAQLILSSPKNEMYFLDYALTELPNNLPGLVEMYNQGIEAGMESIAENSDIFRSQKPKAGMFLWVEVPDGISTSLELGKIMHENLVAYSPGIWFQPQQRILPDGTLIGPEIADNKMRICVVTEEPKIVKESLNKLANAFRQIASDNGIDLFTTNNQTGEDIFVLPN